VIPEHELFQRIKFRIIIIVAAAGDTFGNPLVFQLAYVLTMLLSSGAEQLDEVDKLGGPKVEDCNFRHAAYLIPLRNSTSGGQSWPLAKLLGTA
jgi:hypothetical protein